MKKSNLTKKILLGLIIAIITFTGKVSSQTVNTIYTSKDTNTHFQLTVYKQKRICGIFKKEDLIVFNDSVVGTHFNGQLTFFKSPYKFKGTTFNCVRGKRNGYSVTQKSYIRKVVALGVCNKVQAIEKCKAYFKPESFVTNYIQPLPYIPVQSTPVNNPSHDPGTINGVGGY